ncbi:MAG: phage tail protein I [Hyphomicrobium sp.]
MTEIVPTPYGEHLLPRSATPLQIALSGSDHRILAAPTWVIRACWNPDDCPEHLLPYLAQAWSVDEWDPAWPVAQRRQVIKDAPAFHKIKGTPEAIQRALSALSIGAIVREWFEYGGSPYRFKIAITLAQGAAWTSASARLVWRTALANKNVRSWLESITVIAPAPANTPVFVGIVTHARLVIGSYIGPVTEITGQNAYVYAGVTTHSRIILNTVIT